MRATRTIQVAAAAAAAVGVVLSVLLGWHTPAWWAIPAFVVAIAAAEMATIRVVIGRQGFTLSLSDCILSVPFVLSPHPWVTLGFILGILLKNIRRVTGIKAVYNAAQYACAIATGLLVAHAAHGGIAGAAAGLIVYASLNHVLVAIPISLVAQRPFRHVLLQTSRLNTIHVLGTISLGLLAAWLAKNAPLGLLSLIAPLALLWWSYQQQTERTAEARLFAELAQGQERASSTSLDSSAGVVITAAARLFGDAEVELILRHPDGPVRYVGDDTGVLSRERSDSGAFATPWVLRAMGARGVLTGVETERPYCSAVLGDPDRPLAVFIARRPARVSAYERVDARLAQVLAGQAEAWLSVAELTARHGAALGRVEAYGESARALGDLGADTSPALVVLRESADRLSRLTYSMNGPDPVRDIVDELHAVERAVASLLGAVALASEQDLVTGADPSQRPGALRVDAEWTTTGRLDAYELN